MLQYREDSFCGVRIFRSMMHMNFAYSAPNYNSTSSRQWTYLGRSRQNRQYLSQDS